VTFTFNQPVTVTRNGTSERAVFIGYMTNGHEAQVNLTDRKYKPNVIVPLGQIADVIQGAKTPRKAKAENAGHEQPVGMGATGS
jgi:hypothetical protein